MPETSSPIEIVNPSPKETVRCIIENSRGEILLLQKTADSKAPNLYEFPGGKIDEIASNASTEKEQLNSINNEINEETGIDISSLLPQKVGEFDYKFTTQGTSHERRVHLFYLKLDSDQVVTVNTTENSQGQSEDNHQQFVWKTKEELKQMKEDGLLSGNSQHFEKILQVPPHA